jgi:hypothetical protein
MVEYIVPNSYKYIIKRNPINESSVEIIPNHHGLNTNTPYIIDLSSFDTITTVDIYDLSLCTVLLPPYLNNLGVYNSQIQKLDIPESITTITLQNSPGVYANITNIPSSVVSISISGDNISNFKIPDEVIVLSLYKCKIDKITNIEHHIEKETNRINIHESNMIIVFEDVESPYTLAHIQTYPEWNFTFVQNIYSSLEKLYIIQNTNQDIETKDIVDLAVRLRLNVFRQETHISNTNTIDTKSSIYNVMRLGSNYPRRWIEFVIHTR